MTGRGAPARPRHAGADLQVIGALLVLAGVAWLLRQTALVELELQTVLSGLLLALGVGMVVTARRAGGAPLVAIGLALTALLAATSSVELGSVQRNIGDRTFRPTTAVELRDTYQVGIGQLLVDLREMGDLRGERRVLLRATGGSIVVLLPPAMVVDVEAEVDAGKVVLPGDIVHDGSNLRRRYTDPGYEAATDKLRLDLDVGGGTASVERASG